jgi:hypothetical protein
MKLFKLFAFLPTFISVSALADSEQIKVFLDFEKDYLSNNVAAIAPWFIEDPELAQTIHFPGGSDTVKAKKDQLLASIKQSKTPNTISDNGQIQVPSSLNSHFVSGCSDNIFFKSWLA